MASIATSQLGALLEHLPVASTADYGKRQKIYSPDDRSNSIYLVLTGKVGLSQIAEDGSEVLLEILRPDELFGESVFFGGLRGSEQATAIEDVKLMTWAISDMEDLVIKQPRLGLTLLQVLAQRNAEFTRRIEGFSIDGIERRLARSLIRFSDRLGVAEEGGAVRMMPITHALLSRYVGTSREIVSHHMNRFRKQGYLDYSRRGILLYRDALMTVLGGSGLSSSGKSS